MDDDPTWKAAARILCESFIIAFLLVLPFLIAEFTGYWVTELFFG